MQAKLIVVEPEIQPNQYELSLPMTIGRGRDSRLKLMHALVSRRHCELFEESGKLMVRDLGSLNGTFVGGERVETAPLPPGGLLTIGSVTFRAVYGDDSDSSTQMMLPIDADTVADTARMEETTEAEATARSSTETEEDPAPWDFEDKEQPPLTLAEDVSDELPLADASPATPTVSELPEAEELEGVTEDVSFEDTEIPPLRLVDEDSLPLELPEMDALPESNLPQSTAADDTDLDSWFDSLELEDEPKKPDDQ